MDQNIALMACAVPTVLFAVFDFSRRYVLKDFNRWFITNSRTILRPEEHWDKPASAFFFLLG
jgi:hypothetical protein